MGEFFAMGGYGAYVWPAFGITAIILIGLAVVSVRGLRTREALLDRLQNEESRET